jgi:Phosphopantetheinyl transferase
MSAAHAPVPTNLAEALHEDEIHVWQLHYRPATRRRPLLELLATYLAVDAHDVCLYEDIHGKPALGAAHAGELQFNWSHSGSCAVVALGRHLELGIDVEQRRPRPRALEIAKRYFTAAETSSLAALPVGERDEAFLQLWTAKEAVLKALGRGIAFGLHRLDIARVDGRLSLLQLDGHDADAWQLQPLSLPDPSLVAALAWQGAPRTIRLHGPDDLARLGHGVPLADPLP